MTYIPEYLRREVYERASGQCEYCLIDERFTVKRHEVDHIRAEKHFGLTVSANLCLSCFDCNRHKGSDLSSVDPISDEVVTLFHPRRDNTFKWMQDEQVLIAADDSIGVAINRQFEEFIVFGIAADL
jgi:hypothetical protein